MNFLDLYGYFDRTNARLILALNHWLADRPGLYNIALTLTNHGTDVVVALTLCWLWFWPEKPRQSLLGDMQLPPRTPDALPDAAVSTANGSGGVVASGASAGALGVLTRNKAMSGAAIMKLPRLKRSAAPMALSKRAEADLTRLESRAQLLVVGAALMLAYIAARLVGVEVNISRPFATYLPLHEGAYNAGSFQALARRSDGSFPSNHAVLLAALPAALFYWNKPVAAWGWLIFSAVLMVIRVACGFHYPLDMIAGAATGMLFVYLAMSLYRREGFVYRAANASARGFDLSNSPYCYILYAFVALIGLELFLFHLNHIMQTIFSIRGMIIYRFTH